MWWCPSHREGGRDSQCGCDQVAWSIPPTLNLYHPHHHCCLSIYFFIFRLGWELQDVSLLYCLCFPNTMGCAAWESLPHCHKTSFCTHVSWSSRAQWFFGSSFEKNYHQNTFPFGNRKWVQCFCPVQARLEIPNHLIRELLILNYNNFWTCKPSLGSL